MKTQIQLHNPDLDTPVLHTGQIFNVVSTNAGGIRTKFKRDMLGKLLLDLQAGVGLITETRHGKLYHTKCPKGYCYNRDSFLHMINCYHLAESVKRGAEALPLLLQMARSTKRKPGHPPFPYLEPLSSATRRQDAAPNLLHPRSPARSDSSANHSD